MDQQAEAGILKKELYGQFKYLQRVRQEIAGQRITKVVKSVTYVEDRVNALINVWGKDEIDSIEVKAEKEKTEDEKLLAGPALEGEGISQDEIDKLFD